MESILIHDWKTFEPLINRAKYCRIGLSLDDMPYVVPMLFGYRDSRVYLHTSPSGKKAEILKLNRNACFEIDIDQEIIPSDKICNWSMRYRSVIAFGKASIIDDPREKAEALEILVSHYSGENNFEFPGKDLDQAMLVRVDIEKMTAKLKGYKSPLVID